MAEAGAGGARGQAASDVSVTEGGAETPRELAAALGAGLSADLLESDRYAAYGRLLGGLVHHLRTPLATAVFSQQELAVPVAPGAAPSSQEASLALLRRSLARIASSLEMLSSRYERELQEEPSTLELNELVQGELALLAFDARLRYQVSPRLSLAADELTGWGVAREVAQAIRNAVVAALAAVEHEPRPELRVTTERVGDELQLRLEAGASPDPGVGGDARAAAAAISGASAGRAWGGGPELVVASALLARAGGSLHVRTPAAGGLELSLRLPARAAPSANGARPSGAPR